MAILDKKPITEIKTDAYAAEKVMSVADKEHQKRHDEWHKKDMELAASLQSHWAERVASEHRPN